MSARIKIEDKGPGRPEYVPSDKDREWVRFALAMGARKESMLAILAISEPTFDKHFKLDWDEGKTQLGLRVSEEVVKRAFGYSFMGEVQKRKRGNLVWARGTGEPVMVPKVMHVPGDNNLLLRLFNAWVSRDTNRIEHTGKDGKDLPPTSQYTQVILPVNGYETGSGGSRLKSLERMRLTLEAEIAAAKKPALGQTQH